MSINKPGENSKTGYSVTVGKTAIRHQGENLTNPANVGPFSIQGTREYTLETNHVNGESITQSFV